VTHDNRRMQPFPIYSERTEGAYKWDMDGHRYIDYWMGLGALLRRVGEWVDCGSTRVCATRRTTCWQASTTGSPRGLIAWTCARLGCC
jgi:hypothetical protein